MKSRHHAIRAGLLAPWANTRDAAHLCAHLGQETVLQFPAQIPCDRCSAFAAATRSVWIKVNTARASATWLARADPGIDRKGAAP